ncbi:MAG: cholesterol esterase [Caeruleum heppii]|nr:MAG: cholesterol esterase [Caeruleum heppii]
MTRVPLVGRLFFREYLALVGSFLLIGLEGVIRIITLALPQFLIRLFYNASRRLFNLLSAPKGRKSRTKRKTIVNDIRDASDFVDMCALYGYYAEEHIVQTGDGYLLGLHRLGWKRGEEGQRINSGPNSVKKRVVYLHHGLLMNSEVWVCITDPERCLPFQLVEKGFDVWLGNNRGNKYSKKSTLHSPTSTAFWNFSMDQFAFHDIPDSISYILSTTSQPSLSYIGFSQGTAQAFATLSIHPTLNDQIDVFIALAPAMSPAGLSNGIVDALMKASPEVIFLAFGRRSILSSATMWQAILYPPIFVRVIDISLRFLFNWRGRNISPHQKLAAYPHLYSYTSTKSVVHWFQIIRNKSFQMYDDEVQPPLSLTRRGGKYYKVAKFPTRNIKTPIVLVWGGSDSLVDMSVMLRELPKHTVAKEIPHFEHLDFLWADGVESLVFPHVFDALEAYADPTNAKDLLLQMHRGSVTAPPGYSEDERLNGTEGESESDVQSRRTGNGVVTQTPRNHPPRVFDRTPLSASSTSPSTPSPSHPSSSTPTPVALSSNPNRSSWPSFNPFTRKKTPSPKPSPNPSTSTIPAHHAGPQSSPSTSPSLSTTSLQSVLPSSTSKPLRTSAGQSQTHSNPHFIPKGIDLGAGRAAVGDVSGDEVEGRVGRGRR